MIANGGENNKHSYCLYTLSLLCVCFGFRCWPWRWDQRFTHLSINFCRFVLFSNHDKRSGIVLYCFASSKNSIEQYGVSIDTAPNMKNDDLGRYISLQKCYKNQSKRFMWSALSNQYVCWVSTTTTQIKIIFNDHVLKWTV